MHDETIRKRLLKLGIYLCIITLLIFCILTFLIKRALEYGMRNHYESDGKFNMPTVHVSAIMDIITISVISFISGLGCH